jgi:phytol kinase
MQAFYCYRVLGSAKPNRIMLTRSLILSHLSTLAVILLCGPLALLWAYCCLSFAGYLKCVRGFNTGYTRKIFHVLIFLSAVAVQTFWGFAAVCLFGTMVSLVIAYAVLRGAGNRFYEALAREQDGPHRTYYIVLPYFATLIGGVASNIFFGPLAVVGYLVGGLGDAAGEPVGTRWGKHRYLIPAFGRAPGTTRSYEGSLGVLIVSLTALFLATAISPDIHLNARSAITLPVIAIACTLVEAVSPHGWDNTPMQIVPTLLAATLLLR